MDPALRASMRRYYDERAPEYEDAYRRGLGTSSLPDPTVFQTEAVQLARIVERLDGGDLIDLACGTAYWLPHYAPRCGAITLVDQSPRMLDEARQKIVALDIVDRCTVVKADVLDHPFPAQAFDTALFGFLISHLTEAQESRLFGALRPMLRPTGRALVLDSAYSLARARVNAKEERQRRRLGDGTEFEIYKRYLDEQDAARWGRDYGAPTHRSPSASERALSRRRVRRRAVERGCQSARATGCNGANPCRPARDQRVSAADSNSRTLRWSTLQSCSLQGHSPRLSRSSAQATTRCGLWTRCWNSACTTSREPATSQPPRPRASWSAPAARTWRVRLAQSRSSARVRRAQSPAPPVHTLPPP